MAEYIEREAMVKASCERCIWGDVSCNKERCILMEVIHSLPAADVRPVVLCKDCKHRQYDAMFDHSWCNGHRVTDDWFCADGEKREES